MLQIAVLVRPEGVFKTQVYASDDQQVEGSRLFEKILPGIRQIDAILCGNNEPAVVPLSETET